MSSGPAFEEVVPASGFVIDAVDVLRVHRNIPVQVCLNRGKFSVIRTVVFGLWNRELVNITEEGENIKISSVQSYDRPSQAIEREIQEYPRTPRNPAIFFRTPICRTVSGRIWNPSTESWRSCIWLAMVQIASALGQPPWR